MDLENTIEELSSSKKENSNISIDASQRCWETIRKGINKERPWHVRLFIKIRHISDSIHLRLVVKAALVIMLIVFIPAGISKTIGFFNKSANDGIYKTPAGNDAKKLTSTGDAGIKDKNTEPAPDNTKPEVSSGVGVVKDKNGKVEFPVHLYPKSAYSMFEDDNYIYYCSDQGINKVNKSNGDTSLIYKLTDPQNLYLDGNYLYFVDESSEYPSINRIDKDGKNLYKVLDSKKILSISPSFEDVKDIRRLKVHGKKICFSDGYLSGFFLLDLSSNKLKLITDDIENFDMTDTSVYFTHHAARDFTIYKTDYKDLKTKILIGNGKEKSRDDTNIYDSDNFIFIGDTLYFASRQPWELCKLQNGKTSVISKAQNENIIDVLEYRGELYYTMHNIDTNKVFLMKYDAKNNNSIQLFDFKDIDFYTLSTTIINGYFYYTETTTYEKKSFKLSK